MEHEAAAVTLDHKLGIVLDRSAPPIANMQAFGHNYHGLQILAGAVRECERQVVINDPHADKVVLHAFMHPPPIVPNAFSWYSLTLVNYLRVVALVDFLSSNKFTSLALTEEVVRKKVKAHCTDYVREAIPEIYTWRNKVAAHYAATDPFINDNLGTLEQSLMDPVTYAYPYFRVGRLKWNASGAQSDLPEWALTETHERLAPRFWPEAGLKPMRD